MHRTGLAMALLALAAVGCSGEDEREKPEPRTGTAARQALSDHVRLSAAGDPKACDYETDAFQKYADKLFVAGSGRSDNSEVSCAARIQETPGLMENLEIGYGPATLHLVRSDSDTATVRATYPDGPAELYTLVYEVGLWRVDDDHGTSYWIRLGAARR